MYILALKKVDGEGKEIPVKQLEWDLMLLFKKHSISALQAAKDDESLDMLQDVLSNGIDGYETEE